MLVNLKDILKIAEANKCAVGSFNTPNFESIKAVIGAAEELNQPVVIMHAQIHEEMDVCKMDEIAPLMLFMADKAKVPVCVHLDHGTDLDYVKKGIDIGFTSVMYDGSAESVELNTANTCIITSIAQKKGVSVEAEVGSMGSREGGGEAGQSIYTDPELAFEFVKETGIDALACAFGTAHGLYKEQPKLDFDRVRRVKELTKMPIVMHGGSGVSEEDYRKVIECGVRKINYYTYMAKAGGEAVAKLSDDIFFHDAVVAVENAMKRNAKQAIAVFAGMSHWWGKDECVHF